MDYQSAHDLPSFVEMAQQLKALRTLGFLIPKAERPDMKALKSQLQHMGDTVDRFYAVLGPRHWIFHDTLPLDDIAGLLDSRTDATDVEMGLIALYNDPDSLRVMIAPLRSFPAMAKRMQLVQMAQDDYVSGRYYASIHVLLSVMDGFVNEFETVRRGLHTREAEELKAWDSVVGHHMGLTNAHKTFTKGKSATNEEPIHELYRNGIVHGSQLNYNNITVATKAWNRLFAVADWAKARLKEQQPPASKVTWKELFSQLAENDKHRRAIAAWKPSALEAGQERFNGHPVVALTTEYLTAWVSKNYGRMAKLLSADESRRHGNAMPRLVRLDYENITLASYEIRAIDHTAPAVCLAKVQLRLADGTHSIAELRWLHEDDNGDPIVSSLPGHWRLRNWNPWRFFA